MSNIVVDDNFIWDLDGLINIDELGVGNIHNMSILLEAVKKTDKYTRSKIFGQDLEYTTSPEIYEKLGLLSFSFHELDNLIKYSLVGNLDIIESLHPNDNSNRLYSHLYNYRIREVFSEKRVIDAGSKKFNFTDFMKYLRLDKCEIIDMQKIFNSCFTYDVDFNSEYLRKYFLNFLSEYDIHLLKPVNIMLDKSLFKIKDISSFGRLNTYLEDLKTLSNYSFINLHIDFYSLVSSLCNNSNSFMIYICKNLNETNVKFVCKDLRKYNLTLYDWLDLEVCPKGTEGVRFQKYKDIVRLYLYKYLKIL